MSEPAITIRACAKINLVLSVGPPIPEGPHAGFHEIASWMAPIDVADTVVLRRGDAAPHRIHWGDEGNGQGDAPRAADWPIESDLGVRMLEAVRRHTGLPLPVSITIEKRIPAGGGLGGGSSDAVAVLQGLDALFDLRLNASEKLSLATGIGSDCAFFVDSDHPTNTAATGVPAEQSGSLDHRPRPALVLGLGDRIERLPRIRGDLLLILPDAGCPTGAVYRAYDTSPSRLDEARVRRVIRDAMARGEIDTAAVFNDLDSAAESITPALSARHTVFRAIGTPVHMSGSGSTLWCMLPEDFLDRAAVLSSVERVLPHGWRTMMVRLV